MNETCLSSVVEKVESLFSTFNYLFYNNELEKVIITVNSQNSRNTFGWCTSWKAWGDAKEKMEGVENSQNEGYFEINICAEYLSKPFDQVVATLLHEMVHLYNLQKGVQDTSRMGTYHNKEFKEAAEQHGLITEKAGNSGWCVTSLNEDAKAFIDGMHEKDFKLFRKTVSKTTKQKQSTRKYVCPICGTIIRATKNVNVVCGDCNVTYRN